MSYVIHVWESPRPASFDEAAQIAFDLAEDVVGQNPAFLVLAERLTARFPCITRAPDGVWSDGPLDGKTEERIYVLGISDSHEEVFAHIVECAASLGLTVFDMQAAIAYLPSGQMLAQLPAAPPATLPEPPAAPLFVAASPTSYLVHVWEVPRLHNHWEAAQTVSELGGDLLGQNLRFEVLAEWLNARYDCDTLESWGVWRNGRPDGRTEKRVLVLDICARHEEVVAYIAHCASRLRLSVFDRQTQTAWNANGGRIRTDPPPRVPPAPTVPMRERLDIREAAYEGMMRVLGDVGFVYDRTDEGRLILRFPGGYHEIGVPVTNWYPLCYRFKFFVTTRLDEVVAITAPFRGTRPEYVERIPCSQFNYGYLYGEKDKEYEVDSREGLALAITEMNIVIVNKLLPLLDRISDVRGMDALFNGPPTDPPFQSHCDWGFTALTLARLADNPDYPALCARYLNAVYPGNRQVRRDLPRLIAYLDHYDGDHPVPPPPFPFDEATRFIAEYDGSQCAEIEYRSVGTAGQECFDMNSGFRAELLQNRSPTVLSFPLPLLRDLLRAEARVRTSLEGIELRTIGTLCKSLLSRGGLAELALVAKCVPATWLSDERMMEVAFAPDMAESLRHACEKRSCNPKYGEMAEQYGAFEKYFAAPKLLRGEDFYNLFTSLKLPRCHAYDDFAGTNAKLWEGKHLSLVLISERGYLPSVRITVFQEPHSFYHFHCEVKKFDEFSIQDFLRYVVDHEAEVRDAAVRAAQAKKDLHISVLPPGSAWIFKQRLRGTD